jgi:transcription elongation factor SPT5
MDDLSHDVSRDICLPSIKDSKLWRIKVTPGRERELVVKILNKLIDYLNNGDPLNVLEVFECQLSSGIIYCEAYKS